MKKKILLFLLILVAAACALAGCSDLKKQSMKIECTYYNDGEIISPTSESTLLIEDGGLEITMDVTLELEGGKISFEVYGYRGELAWSGEYTESASFTIVLEDVLSDSSYRLKVSAENITRAHVLITSDQMKVKTPFDR
ncbi:MAG: hypothetical protein K2K28_01375 [Clostridia bacterium]|nr:hypothetical protein [Clostridia bacterium]